MSSEAITRNDLTAILNEVLPPTPSEYKKLLWTNPSPTANFATQTVNIDLTNYDAIEILTSYATTNTNYGMTTEVIPVGTGKLQSVYVPQAQGTVRTTRGATVSSTGVTFTGGGYVNGTTYTAGDGYCIPLLIYGIKYERVAPPLADIEVVPIVSGNTGTILYRIGNIRVLYINGTTGSDLSGITISSIDLPTVDIRGVGVRRDSSASGTQIGMIVLRASTGKLDVYRCGTYGSTVSAIGSTDTMAGMLLWSV